MPKCCICGTIRNCEIYLDRIFKNIEKIGTLFEDYKIIFYYDASHDNTLAKLKEYQKRNKRLELFINTEPLSRFRTHRIAKGRNRCLQRIREAYGDYGYFIMIDCDDVCSNDIHLDVLKRALYREDWDAISFNKTPYYDTWALSIRPYMYSYLHFENASQACYNQQSYVERKLKALPKDRLLPCCSAFSGFAIYKSHKFLNCNYDGRLKVNLFSKKILQENILAHNMKFIPNRENSLEQSIFEDCEHRSFHLQAVTNNRARICISPEFLFIPSW